MSVDKFYGAKGLSKAEQCGHAIKSERDFDTHMKLALACVWVEWLRHKYQMPVSVDFMPPMDCVGGVAVPYKALHLDHIGNKTRHDRFSLSNVQLIRPDTHRDKTDSGKYTDYRPTEFTAWLEELLK